MAVREHYGIDGDSRKFDSVMEAVQAAGIASVERGGAKIKVFRSVMYTHSVEPTVSTLTIIEIPPDIPVEMLQNPNKPLDPNVHGVMGSARRGTQPSTRYPTYPTGETVEQSRLTPTLPPMPPATVQSDNSLNHSPLKKAWKPCFSCGRK